MSNHRRQDTVLNWKWDDGFYFAHAPYGLWSIEQKRGKFYIQLDIGKVGENTQDFGDQPTSAKAKAEAQRAHRSFLKMEG